MFHVTFHREMTTDQIATVRFAFKTEDEATTFANIALKHCDNYKGITVIIEQEEETAND